MRLLVLQQYDAEDLTRIIEAFKGFACREVFVRGNPDDRVLFRLPCRLERHDHHDRRRAHHCKGALLVNYADGAFDA